MRDPFLPGPMGPSVFFTTGLHDSGSDLLLREVAILREAVRVARRSMPFRIDAWVVLPDHMHCVWTLPADDTDVSERWRMIKAQVSRELGRRGRLPEGCGDHLSAGRRARGEIGLWRRGASQRVLGGASDRDAAVRCCWRDPVLHGLVARPEDWRWSSIHRDLRLIGPDAPRDSLGTQSLAARGSSPMQAQADLPLVLH